ncbi:head-tail connector protein [Bacillus ndiopicus]|uniref:hypothetical protein n=1 Tax=Bacillus ndiopicus TaxID=1347368 RepID=UPI0005A8A85C|nr:hypothetical protein [Bacillus ndiopicus]
MDVFKITRSKIPIEQISDEKLLLKIEEVAQAIKIYCNRTDVPEDLKFVHANMVVDTITEKKKMDDPSESVVAKSVKEGDVSVEFGSNATASERATSQILTSYIPQLNRFRKLRR